MREHCGSPDCSSYLPAYVNDAWPDTFILCTFFETRSRHKPPKTRAFCGSFSNDAFGGRQVSRIVELWDARLLCERSLGIEGSK